MQKLFLRMAIMMCAASVTNAFAAQSNSITSIGGVAVPATPDNGQVMSNEAFKGTVEKFGTEAKQEINKTVQEQIKSSTSAAGTPPTSSSSTNTSSPATAPSNNFDSGNNSSNQPNTSISNQPVGSKPSSASTPQSTSTPAPSDSYTGFGGDQTKSKSGDTGNKKGSSWNVGY